MALLSTNEVKDIQKLADGLSELSFKMFSSGDLLILKAVSLLGKEANATNVMMAMTMSQGRMTTLSQVSPILKDMVGKGLLNSSEKPSTKTTRPMQVYSLTRKGSKVIDLGVQLVEALTKERATAA